MKSKITRKIKLEYIIIFFVVMIFVIGLLPINYATDTYNIIELGFSQYAKEWFAPAGRSVGVIVLFFLEQTNLTCDGYIFIMKLISIIFATITISIFYNLLINITEEKNKVKKIGFLLATLVIFLNNATYQYFYYPESGIMWLGIFCCVLAIKSFLRENDKYRYVKSGIYIFASMNCYQAIILFYIPALIFFIGIKSKTIKDFIVEMLKSVVIIIINLLLGYCILKVLTYAFDVEPYRDTSIKIRLDSILKLIKDLLKYCNDGFPNFYITYILGVFGALALIINKKRFFIKKEKFIFEIFSIALISLIEIILIIGIVDFYLCDRIQFAYITTIGLISIYFIQYIQINKHYNIFITCFVSLILILNISNSFSLTYYHRITRKRDINIGNAMYEEVVKYENSNNKIISKVKYCYDNNPTCCDEDVRVTYEATQRVMHSDWVLDNAIRYFLNKDIEVEEKEDIYQEIFERKEWDEFSLEQIRFIDDTMYYCIY